MRFRPLVAASLAFLALSAAGAAELLPLDAYLSQRAAKTGFSGAVLVARGDEVLLRRAYGWAEIELEVELSTAHIFRVGSLTKPLTAMATLALVEESDLSLDARLCGFLTACPDGWGPVTVEHLLSHTSGTPNLFGDLPEAPVEETAAEIDRLLASSDSLALISAPGAEYRYSNFNYMLLGYVIERASGETWEGYLEKSLFGPLEMESTAYDDVWELVHGRARGYTRRDGHPRHVEYDDHSAYAAGGLRSTIDDLDRFLVALLDGRIVSDALVARATRPVRTNYGLGWQVLELFGHRMFNHTGGIDGFSSHVAVYPEEGLRLIVLSNNEREDAKATACDLAALVFGTQPAPSGAPSWLERPREERCKETNR